MSISNLLIFGLRFVMVVALWSAIWQFTTPKTQLMKVLRAAMIVIGLAGILAAVRLTGG